MEQLELSPIFRSLSDILGILVPQDCIGLGFDEWPELLERAGSGIEMEKALQVVVSILQYLEETSPENLAPVTKILADGSRYGELLLKYLVAIRNFQKHLAEMLLEPLRLPFGDMGVLEFYLNLLSKDVDEHDWTSDALRLVGNTCADLGSYRNKVLLFIVTDLAFRYQQRTCTRKTEITSLASTLDRRRQGKCCPWCAV